MASKDDLPWHWVIETLADLKQADTSLLRALIARVPNFLTDATESVRERVALRYLEECSRGADAPVTSGSSRGIDVSRSAEEVLCSHLKKVAPLRTLEKSGDELFCHDLHQFVLHKRAALPKPYLERLKESTLEGRCQAAASLIECSGLFRPNQVDHVQSKGAGEYGSAKKLKFSTNAGENHSLIQDSVALAPNSGGVILQEEPSGSEKHFPEQDVRNDPCRNFHITAGNDVLLLEKGSMCQLPAEKNTNLNDCEIRSLNQGAAPARDNAGISLQNQILPVQNVSDYDRRKDLHRDIVSTGANNVLFSRQNSLPQPPCKENIIVQHAPLNGSKKNINQPRRENDHFDGEPSVVLETRSDDDELDGMPSNFDPNDEMFTNEKHQLLSSQVHASHDSISGDWTEQSLCIKCDKGGQLLSCSASGCSVAVHESCLGPLVNSKETRVFYCAFCSYTRSAIAYCNARKNVIRARKALSAFIGRDLVQGHQKKPTPAENPRGPSQPGVVGNENTQRSLHSLQYQGDKSSEGFLTVKEKHQQTEADNVCNKGDAPSRYVEAPVSDVSRNAVEIHQGEMAKNNQGIAQLQPNQPSDSANITDNGKLPCGHKVTSPVCQDADVTFVNGEGEVANDHEQIEVADHQQLAEPHAATVNCNLAHEDLDASQIRYCDVPRAKVEDGISLVDGYAHLRKLRNKEQIKAAPVPHFDGEKLTRQPSERPAKRSRQDRDVGKIHHPLENVKNMNREKSSSCRSSRREVRPIRYSNRMPTLGRRTKRYWTPEEEEALKMAVKKFAPDSDGNLPWTKILEFGRRIFDTTRQPVDLKDKWRNIMKKEH